MEKKIKDRLLDLRAKRKLQMAMVENNVIKIMKDDVRYIDDVIRGVYPVEALVKRMKFSSKWLADFCDKRK